MTHSDYISYNREPTLKPFTEVVHETFTTSQFAPSYYPSQNHSSNLRPQSTKLNHSLSSGKLNRARSKIFQLELDVVSFLTHVKLIIKDIQSMGLPSRLLDKTSGGSSRMSHLDWKIGCCSRSFDVDDGFG